MTRKRNAEQAAAARAAAARFEAAQREAGHKRLAVWVPGDPAVIERVKALAQEERRLWRLQHAPWHRNSVVDAASDTGDGSEPPRSGQ
jgi:ribosomal protein S11